MLEIIFRSHNHQKVVKNRIKKKYESVFFAILNEQYILNGVDNGEKKSEQRKVKVTMMIMLMTNLKRTM